MIKMLYERLGFSTNRLRNEKMRETIDTTGISYSTFKQKKLIHLDEKKAN